MILRPSAWLGLLAACLALLLVLAPWGATRAQQSVIAYAVRSDADDRLYAIDLVTGAANAIGPVGFFDVEALAFSCDGTLYGIDDASERLIRIDLRTGAGTDLGSLGVSIEDTGLTFTPDGALFMAADDPQTFYRVDLVTGRATPVGSLGQPVTGLVAGGATIYGLGGDNENNLVTIDRATGRASAVGPLRTVQVVDGGIDFAPDGTLWGLNDGGPGGGGSQIFTIDPGTGAATVVATARLGNLVPLDGFESLAIPGGGPCQTAEVVVPPSPGDDDTDDKPRLTEEQRQQRERTNRSGKDDVYTEGNVATRRCAGDPPEIEIANRDGLVRVRLLGAGADETCRTLRIGDYVELDGTKVHEQLFEADSITVRR